MFWIALRSLVWLVAPVAVVFGLLGWDSVLTGPWPSHLRNPALIGLAFGATLAAALETRYAILRILRHEITHLLVVMLLLRRAERLAATNRDGQVEWHGTTSNFMVSLAPYSIPLLPLLWLPVAWITTLDCLPAYALVMGMLVGIHLWSVGLECRPYQPDLQESGVWFSLLFILACNLCLLCLIAAFLLGGAAGVAELSQDVGRSTIAFGRRLGEFAAFCMNAH